MPLEKCFRIYLNCNSCQEMNFQGDQPIKAKGKRTSGFQTQKDGGFSLGWDVSNQMNDFQMKKQQKGQNMAAKVTTQYQQRPTQSRGGQSISFEDQCKKLIMENPNITTEELQQRMALWEANLNSMNRAPERNDKQNEMRYEKVKPQESAKNIIYGQQNNQNTTAGKNRVSRRNQGTFSLGDGYNYFKDNGKK